MGHGRRLGLLVLSAGAGRKCLLLCTGKIKVVFPGIFSTEIATRVACLRGVVGSLVISGGWRL